MPEAGVEISGMFAPGMEGMPELMRHREPGEVSKKLGLKPWGCRGEALAARKTGSRHDGGPWGWRRPSWAKARKAAGRGWSQSPWSADEEEFPHPREPVR
jgi:hypothetical protein